MEATTPLPWRGPTKDATLHLLLARDHPLDQEKGEQHLNSGPVLRLLSTGMLSVIDTVNAHLEPQLWLQTARSLARSRY